MVRKKRLFLVGIPILVAVAVCLAVGMHLFTVTMSPSVRIVNASGQTLEKVRCTLREGRIWTETIGELKPGESVEFTGSTSDLYVVSLEFHLRGSHRQCKDGGIATPGEIYVITVDGDGEVSADYEFKW